MGAVEVVAWSCVECDVTDVEYSQFDFDYCVPCWEALMAEAGYVLDVDRQVYRHKCASDDVPLDFDAACRCG